MICTGFWYFLKTAEMFAKGVRTNPKNSLEFFLTVDLPYYLLFRTGCASSNIYGVAKWTFSSCHGAVVADLSWVPQRNRFPYCASSFLWRNWLKTMWGGTKLNLGAGTIGVWGIGG